MFIATTKTGFQNSWMTCLIITSIPLNVSFAVGTNQWTFIWKAKDAEIQLGFLTFVQRANLSKAEAIQSHRHI
jgi:hypothetical protein